MSNLSNRIKLEARRLGFNLVGITQPDPPNSYPKYLEWIEAGYHGEMGYLAADEAVLKRGDPNKILDSCQSILLLGIYHQSADTYPTPNSTQPHGRVAAYAWNDDYHDVLIPRLKALVAFIETETGEKIPNRWYTDTGAILERDLAQRAGLGWIGKNGMLINPKSGSYFLLAEILLGIALEPDPPFIADHCGSCTRCIDACPTDCILPNRTLDARRCISYLTIELKGAIPHELRSQIGDWLFGCDVCQQVCPWNLRFAPDVAEPAFSPRHTLPWVALKQELALSAEEFNRKFKGSPIKRTKRRGYLRNAAVVLGNIGDPSSVPALSKSMREDSEPLVRGHAAWALGQIAGEPAKDALQQAESTEEDPDVLREIKLALDNL